MCSLVFPVNKDILWRRSCQSMFETKGRQSVTFASMRDHSLRHSTRWRERCESCTTQIHAGGSNISRRRTPEIQNNLLYPTTLRHDSFRRDFVSGFLSDQVSMIVSILTIAGEGAEQA